MREIGVRQPHVPRLIGVALDRRLLPQCPGDERDQAVQPHARPAAQIHRLDGAGRRPRRPVQGGQNAVQGVGNIGVVALARPIPMHPDRPPPRDQIGELVDRQIGALPGAVHGKEPQADDIERVQMREGMRQQLSRALAGGVRRDRRDRGLGFGERRRRRVAIDGRR